jgi:hypothetical protein
MKKPDFFIIGAPKCGTTALVAYLAEHPDIFMARKEMHFFGSDLHFGPQFYRRDLPAYLAEFRARNGHRRAGESSVWYLLSEQAAAEIWNFNPTARIVIMLREPVAMLYSLYHQFRCDGNEPLATFAEALNAETDRRAGRRLSRLTYFPQGLAYREVARYTDQVRRYIETFGRNRVQVVLFDELAADSAAVYCNVLRFLDVKSVPATTDFDVINGCKETKSPALRSILSDPWVRGTAIAAGRRLPRWCLTTMQKIESRLGRFNTRPLHRLPMDPELQAQLQKEFAPEIERLGELLERDLSHWNGRKRSSKELVPAVEAAGELVRG